MVVLIDTNVILDDLLDREPFAEMSHCILKLAAEKEIAAYIAWHSIPADYIITRNIEDFTNSKVPPILPSDFLKKFTH